MGDTAVLQPDDGKIVMGGSRNTNSGASWLLTRINANGTLDTSFGSRGVFTKSVYGKDPNELAQHIILDSSNRIVAAGYAHPSYYVGVVMRLLPNGTLDTSFGKNGVATPRVPFRSWQIQGVAFQGTKILLVGNANLIADGSTDLMVMRLNENGSLDTSFGTGGWVTSNFNYSDRGTKLEVHPNGYIYAAAEIGDGLNWSFRLIRYTADGMLDDSFGTDGDGIVLTYFSGNDSPSAMGIQPDGQILLVGGTPDLNWTIMMRYNPDGTLDPSFGFQGIADSDLGAANNFAFDSSMGICVSGVISNSSTGVDFYVGKFTPWGTVNIGF